MTVSLKSSLISQESDVERTRVKFFGGRLCKLAGDVLSFAPSMTSALKMSVSTLGLGAVVTSSIIATDAHSQSCTSSTNETTNTKIYSCNQSAISSANLFSVSASTNQSANIKVNLSSSTTVSVGTGSGVFRIYGRGSGKVEFSQASSGQDIVALSSVPTAILAANVFDGSGDTSSSVTISATGDISVTSSSDYAVKAFLTTGVNLSSSPTKVGTISVTTADITAGGGGIYTRSKGNVTISAGAIVASANHGIRVNHDQYKSGNIDITASSITVNSGKWKRAVSLEYLKGTPVTISVGVVTHGLGTNTGSIYGDGILLRSLGGDLGDQPVNITLGSANVGSSAVIIVNTRTGSMSVTATGHIVGRSAVDVFTSGSVNISLNSFSARPNVSARYAIDVRGAAVTVSTSGVIRSRGRAMRLAMSGNVTITTSSLVTTSDVNQTIDVRFLSWISAARTISISTAGDVTNTHGQTEGAIYVQGNRNSGTRISISTRNVTASGFAAIKVNSRNANVDITTSGAVKALGTSSSRDSFGIHVRNTGANGQSPTVSINLNSGAVVGTTGKGAILVESGSNNSPLASTITINSGASLIGSVKLGKGNDEFIFNGGSYSLETSEFGANAESGYGGAITLSNDEFQINEGDYGDSQTIDGGESTNDNDILNFNSGNWSIKVSNFKNWETLKVGSSATVKILGKGADYGQEVGIPKVEISGILSLQDRRVGDVIYLEGDLSGTGIIQLDVNFATGYADSIVVQGSASGNLAIKLNDITPTGSAHNVSRNVRLITIPSVASASAFSLEKNFIVAGGYKYRLTVTSGRRIELFGVSAELTCTASSNLTTNTTTYTCNQSSITTTTPYLGTATSTKSANTKVILSSGTSVNFSSTSSFFRIYGRSSGSVTFSQAASGQNIVATSSVPTAILAANVFDGSGDTSSSVMISATGDISVSNSSDYAVKAFLTKGANLSSNPTKVGTISITTADITAGGGGIYTRSKGNVTISAGAIVASANHGIRVKHNQIQSGNIDITASSITVNSGKWKRAVSLEYLKGTPVTISVGVVTHGLGTNTGSIYGDGILLRSLGGDLGDQPVNITLGSANVGSSAVIIVNTRTGSMSVTATGHIVGRSAVDVFTSGSVNISLNSFSARPTVSASQAIDVRGAAVTVSTSGVIRSRGRVMRLAMSGNVTITTSSLVTTSDVNQTIDVRFLEWISAARTISISTAGDVTNTHGQTDGTIYVQGNSNTGTRISISTGNVTASGFAAIKVNSRNANVDITTSGAVKALGTSSSRDIVGIHVRNTGSSGQSPTVTINLNSGAVLGTTGKGAILVESGSDNSPLASTITINSGASLVGSVKLGRGNDEIKFKGGSFTLGHSQTIDGGAGTDDTLNFNSGTWAINTSNFSNWETLKIGTGATVKFLGKGTNNGQDLRFTSLAVSGVLSLQDDIVGDHLDIASNLSGSGDIHVDVDFATKLADQLILTGMSSGNLKIKLNDVTPTNSAHVVDEQIRIITARNFADTSVFSLENNTFTAGGYSYRLTISSGRSIGLQGIRTELACTPSVNTTTNTTNYGCNQSEITTAIPYWGTATASPAANIKIELSSSTSVNLNSGSGFNLYNRMSGGVTFSQASSGQNIVALSGVPTAILAANVFDGSGDTSSSVTISATGDISVSNSSDYAVKAFLTKGAILTINPTKVGSISITTADITAGGGGIFTRSKGNVTISAGAIVASANHGIRVNHNQIQSGNIDITASSITVNSGKWKRAVSLEYLKGAPVTISVGVVTHGLGSNTASIYGDGIVLRSLWGDHGDHPVNITLGSANVGSSAVFALNTRTGTLTVTATGHIVGRSAVDVFTSGSVNISLNSFSARPTVSASQAIDVRGAAVNVSTSGVIRSRGRAMRLAMSGNVTITTSSLVTTSDVNQTIDVRFLEWISAARTISISTAGDVTNTHGQTEGAIYVQGNRNSGTRISISTRNVTASGFAAIKVNSRNANVDITTSGLVRANGESDSRVANGIHIRNTGASGQSPTVTINLNSGSVLGTTGKGALLIESGNNNSQLVSKITINSGASLVGAVKLDRGNDELKFNGGSFTLGNSQTIDGGESTNDNDTLIFNSGNFSLIATQFPNWETLKIGSDATLKFLGKGTNLGQDLTFNSVVLNGALSLQDSTAGDVLDLAGSLSGNGVIQVDVDFANKSADQISISGNVTGKITIKLNDITPTNSEYAIDEPIRLISVPNIASTNAFSLENDSYTVGRYKYRLRVASDRHIELQGQQSDLTCSSVSSSATNTITFTCNQSSISSTITYLGDATSTQTANVRVDLSSSTAVQFGSQSGFFRIYGRASGSVTFSQASSGQNIIALSSVPTAILAANVFDGSGDTSSSVTISATGDISVSNSSDYAVKAFLTKGANLSSSPTKVGSISILTADITAGGGGIYTRSKGNVTISAGTIVASANHGISVNHDQVKSGNIDITASSITVNSGKWKRAVSIVYQKGVPITISVGVVTHGLGSNTASIYGDGITLRSFIDSGNQPINVTIGSANVGSSAVIILNTRTGSMSVTATGHIVGRSAVDVFTSGSVNINLNSFSARPTVSASQAIDVRGAAVNVSTSGVIRSRGRAMRLAMSGNVTITTSSLVTTSDVNQTIDVRFLEWISAARTISISTAGDVTNTHGQTEGAIYVQGNRNTGTRISISTRNVTASGFAAIKVDSRNANVDITTSGLVSANGESDSRVANGIHIRNTGASGQSPTVTINLNSGAVLGTTGKGALLIESGNNNSPLASTITVNSGASIVGSVKLDRGDDELKFNGGNIRLRSSQTIDGGEGTNDNDTLIFNSGNFSLIATKFPNWETLEIGPDASLKFLGKGSNFGQNLTFTSVVLNGVLSLHDSTAGDVLDLAGNLSGNGTIHIDVDFTENIAKADTISIGGNVSGRHTIKLKSVTPAATTDATTVPITIIDVAGTVSANSFVLENPSFSVLGVDYTLSFDKTTRKFKLTGDDGTLKCDENPSSSGTFVCSGAVNNSGGISKVGSGDVNVNLASSSSVTTSGGVAVSVKGGGSVSFSQGSGSGTISASGSSSGVVHATSTGNGSVSINLNGSANLAGSGTAISASANGTGTVTVNVSGVMASHSGATAIHASGNGSRVMVSAGTVSGGKAAVVAKNTSTTGTVVVTMSGKVTSTSGTAIYVQNGSSTGTGTGPTGFGLLRTDLTLAFDGNSIYRTLNTGGRSVDTNSGEGSVYISVSEAVTSTNSTAIHVHNSGAGDVRIAVASVNGKGMGIYAKNENGGNIRITSTGSVITTGTTLKHAGIYARNDKRGDGITLRVSAASGGVGVHIINNGTGGVSLTATGAIVGTVGDGVAVSNSGNNLSIAAVSVMGSDSGIKAVNNGRGNTTIVATGNVVGQRGIGIATSNGSGARAISLMTSSVTGETWGIKVLNKASGSNTRVNATGSVVGKTSHGLEVTHEDTLGDIDLSVTSVTSNLSAIKVHHAGDANISVTTTGKVVASGKDSHGIEATLLGNRGEINVMISSEVVGGAGDGRGIMVETNGQPTNIVLNSGAVVSATSGIAIETGSGDSTIIVKEGASVSGTVELGKGVDTLNFYGGQFGKAIFDGGRDTTVSSSVDNSKDIVNFKLGTFDITASQFNNFERFNIEQGATVNFSGSQTLSVDEFSVLGMINMMDSATDDSLTIAGNMYGGGTVQLDVDFNMGKSDTLNIAGNVQGVTKIQVRDISQKSGSDQNDNITVVKVLGTANKSNFELADSIISGGFEYVLNFDHDNRTFNLVSHSKGARTLLGVPVALFDGFARPESFHQRRTDQAGSYYRGGTSDLGGWSKLINSNLTYKGAQNDRAEYDINAMGLQFGYDFAKLQGIGGSWIYGVMSQYKEVKSGVAFSRFGAGETMTAKGYGIGATATYFSENGAYLDIQAQHNSIKTDFPTSTLGHLMNDVESTSIVLSMEIGQRIKVNDAISALSYGQVAWGEVDTDYFQTEGSQRVAFGVDGGVTARLGVGGEYQKGRYSSFVLVNVAYDAFNQWNVVYNDEIFWDDVGSTKLELSVGGSINVDEKATLFIQGGFGLNSSANLSLGTRLSW